MYEQSAEKKRLRELYRSRRAALSPAELASGSAAAAKHLQDWLAHTPMRVIFGYQAFGGELDLNALWSDPRLGGGLGLPVVGGGGRMEFYLWKTGEPLSANRLGILEPPARASRRLTPDADTLVLVPALAVDARGTRLGYGGGYYDRYFAGFQKARLMALTWSFAFVKDGRLPRSTHDVSVDLVCTESGITDLRSRSTAKP